MKRPAPPASTLFPYTTLFRSNRSGYAVKVNPAKIPKDPAARARVYDNLSRVLGDKPRTLDRKSTRLNSSHSSISYAVFCLKKKKNKKIPHLNANHISRSHTDK